MPVHARQNYEHLFLKDSPLSMTTTEENGVTLGMIVITLVLTTLILLLTLPNIYLDNHIYYESRHLAHLESVKLMLEEEQSIIKIKLEAINYREHLHDD